MLRGSDSGVCLTFHIEFDIPCNLYFRTGNVVPGNYDTVLFLNNIVSESAASRKVFPVNLALDVYYHTDNSATVAGILFEDWESDQVAESLLKSIPLVAEYEPGQFFKRELPSLLALIADISQKLETIVVDGFVTLGAEQRPGLGAHLYHALESATPVIGVAKSRFNETPAETQILRGSSQNPLFVTALGIPLAEAQQKIKSMHGEYRLPSLLRQVDQLCRSTV